MTTTIMYPNYDINKINMDVKCAPIGYEQDFINRIHNDTLHYDTLIQGVNNLPYELRRLIIYSGIIKTPTSKIINDIKNQPLKNYYLSRIVNNNNIYSGYYYNTLYKNKLVQSFHELKDMNKERLLQKLNKEFIKNIVNIKAKKYWTKSKIIKEYLKQE